MGARGEPLMDWNIADRAHVHKHPYHRLLGPEVAGIGLCLYCLSVSSLYLGSSILAGSSCPNVRLSLLKDEVQRQGVGEMVHHVHS